MASHSRSLIRLMGAAKARKLLTGRNCAPLVSLVAKRHGSSGYLPWNYLWQPGPYPKTEEERLAAARKYGMLPEDYRPIPDDGVSSFGDYPDIKPTSYDSRPGLADWDQPEFRRNFNEPMRIDFEFHTYDRMDDCPTYPFSHGQMVLGFFINLFFFVGLPILIFQDARYQPDYMEKPYSYTGRKFYTFEVEE